jgi:hypothetical protein
MTELVPAIGIGIGAGFFAFYITRLLLERTPLDVESSAEHDRADRRGGRPRARTMERLADE